MKTILLASGNLHKKEEFQRLLPAWEIILPQQAGIEWDCEENAPTFTGNALIKALAVKSAGAHLPYPVLADDSGLVIPALGGAPGVRTARYGSEEAGRILEAHERNRFLLKNMEHFTGVDRKASFVCALAVVFSPLRTLVVQEEVTGSILTEEYGEGGFGYDPVFFIDEAQMSMAALSPGQKDVYSHRGRAVRVLERILDNVYFHH